MMKRRALVCACGIWIASGDSSAQPTRKMFRIGILGFGVNSNPNGLQPSDPSVAAFLRGMRELGYVNGENLMIEIRSDAGMPERFPELAAELVRLRVDAIVAGGGLPAVALKQVTSTIPIVMAASVDPVGQGLVRSLSHPGGNVTGMSLLSTETIGKRLELLKEIVPLALVAVLWYRSDPTDWQAAEAAARARGWKLLSLEVRDPGEIEAAFKAAVAARAGALLVLGGGVFFSHRRRLAELAASSRLPAMYGLRPYVEAGGLISHGADLPEVWRSAAGFVDKILKGARPGDLPVEQPTRFELVVNLKAARALGITIPQSLLLRADEVIQ